MSLTNIRPDIAHALSLREVPTNNKVLSASDTQDFVQVSIEVEIPQLGRLTVAA